MEVWQSGSLAMSGTGKTARVYLVTPQRLSEFHNSGSLVARVPDCKLLQNKDLNSGKLCLPTGGEVTYQTSLSVAQRGTTTVATTGVLVDALDALLPPPETLVPLPSHALVSRSGSTCRSSGLGYPISRNPGTTQTQSIVTYRSVSLYGLNLLLVQKAAGDLHQ